MPQRVDDLLETADQAVAENAPLVQRDVKPAGPATVDPGGGPLPRPSGHRVLRHGFRFGSGMRGSGLDGTLEQA